MNGGLSRTERILEKMVERAQKGEMSIQKVLYPGEVKRYSNTSNGFTVSVIAETKSNVHKLVTAEISWGKSFANKEMTDDQKLYVSGQSEAYETRVTMAEMLYLTAMRARNQKP